MNERMALKFWGVRGSLATPVASHLGYGGNTSCMEVVLPGGRSIIFDAGTGIRALGGALAADPAQADRQIPLFLTHFHWDHIAGMPFFAPLYQPGRQIRFYAHNQSGSIRGILEGQMMNPYFPVNFELASARKEFVEMDREAVHVEEAVIRPFPLHHPQGARGYRIEANGAVIVYATDYEHGEAKFDRTLREFAEGADILICDAQYTPAEYERFRGWGHSTWQTATEVARDARVGRLMLFHHDPSRTDEAMEAVVAEARRHFEPTEGAREGLRLAL